MAEAFVKLGIASLVWPGRPSTARSMRDLALAICAVQCHPTAVFAAVPMVGWSLYRLYAARGPAAVLASGAFGATLVAAWLSLYAVQARAPQPATSVSSTIASAVREPLERIRPTAGARTVAEGLDFLYLDPFSGAWPRWVLLAAGLLTAGVVRSGALTAAAVAPPLVAVAAFSLWQGPLGGPYYFLTILPSTAIALAAPLTLLGGRVRVAAIAAFVVIVIALLPARANKLMTAAREPAYGALARGVAEAARGPAVRSVMPAFAVPPGMDALFMFSLAGGRFDAQAPSTVIIAGDGSISYDPPSGR